MDQILLQKAIKLNKRRERRHHWQQFVRSMVMAVVFCTTYALILPAITIEKAPICGMEAHEHTEICYTEQLHAAFACVAAEHRHDGSCMDSWGNYTCGYGEVLLHAHDESCYDEEGSLICTLEEIEAHLHDEACYSASEPCILEECDPHAHDELCFGLVQELICTLEEAEPHSHDKTCYTAASVLVCAEEEGELHTHDEGCFTEETELTCTLEETEGHSHEETCYAETESLICGMEETEGHAHTETCMTVDTALICARPEITVHTHDASCLDENGNRICTILQGAEHIHDDTCFTVGEEPETVLICGQEVHIHEEACYPASESEGIEYFCGYSAHTHSDECTNAEGLLACNVPEHAHEAACVLIGWDPDADVESAEDWEATLEDIEWTDADGENLIAVAESQLGYRESVLNCILEEDGTLSGYTRYGEWDGDPYGAWNTKFAAFCLHYADIDLPTAERCSFWIRDLKSEERYAEAGTYMPQIGDLVFTDGIYTESGLDHVGILTAIDQENGEMTIIEGDVDGEVCEVFYMPDDPAILGYGILVPEVKAEEPAETYICGMESHLHDENCYLSDGTQICTLEEHTHDETCLPPVETIPYTCGMEEHIHEEGCILEDGTLICTLEAHVHTEACLISERILTYDDDTIHAEMKLRGTAELPEDLTLEIYPVTMGSDPANYYAMYMALEAEMDYTRYFMGDVVFYQMALYADGLPYVLPEELTAEVDIDFVEAIFTPEVMAEAARVDTYTLTGSAAVAPMALMSLDDDMGMAAQSAYMAAPAAEESYDAATEGITGLSFQSNGATAFAVALSNTTVTGTFWERVTSAGEINTSDTYMIVSAEGNYALRGYSATNYQKVDVEAVKGNPGYYTITGADTGVMNQLYWRFVVSGTGYKIQNNATKEYIYSSGGWPAFTTRYNSASNFRLTYSSAQDTWRLSAGNAYLGNAGGYYSMQGSGITADFMIFRLSDVTELSIPDDVVDDGETGGGTTTNPDQKPDYAPYITPSGGKTGNTAVGEVAGTYASDPATSQLESLFCKREPPASNVADDGKVLSDKSVIYKDDDYGAFESYDDNTFGVTLSALTQEFIVTETDRVQTPVDVVFILDTSGSMKDTVSGRSRTAIMVDAVNKAMKDILDNHSENRVGITLFSGGAWDFLEMDHYTSSNGVFLEVEQKTFRETSGSSTVPAVVLSDTIRTSAGSKPAEPTTVQGFGTYTQAGIAKGAEMLEGVSDTTYSATYGSGENERTYTVQRQPVIILMSDGEPTYATNNYKDVLSGPHYGNGQSTSGNGQNNQGILGYYTVMSANHYKRMVGIHYEKPALFYTVGMGIYETGTGDMSGNTQDGDNYKRAVLNPTAEAIAELEDGGFNKAYTNDMLRDLLQNNYNQPYVTVGTGWTNDFTGVPHQRLPVLSNPYSNYSYADGAYFGEISDENLNKIFGDILTNSLKINRYGFVLRGNSAAELIDPIGEGMEVKGDPILRYGGRNYEHTSTSVSGNTITYTYSYHYKSTDGSMQEADLSDIRVQITTDANGLQTVTMAIPDNVIPAYVPHFSTEQDAIDFYYESLPVRLIYQVGLTEEAQADVAALKGPGGTLTYYTNRWDADLRGDHAISIFKPTDENPFYAENGPYQEHHTTKSENLTGTDPQAVKCHRDFTVYEGVTVPEIIHDLGNNGKLVFTAEKTLFDIPVQKLWAEGVSQSIWQPVEVQLYRVGEQAELIDTLTLSSENNWQGIFAELPQLESGWYAIAEDAPEGFWASYNTETHPVLVGEKMVTMVRIDGKSAGEVPTVVITNKTSYMLPETGGMGRELFTMSGGLLMLGALGCGYGLRRKRERGRMR